MKNVIKSVVAALAIGSALTVTAMAPVHAADSSGYAQSSQDSHQSRMDPNSPSRTPSIYKGA